MNLIWIIPAEGEGGMKTDNLYAIGIRVFYFPHNPVLTKRRKK